jgi:hypothetical protein
MQINLKKPALLSQETYCVSITEANRLKQLGTELSIILRNTQNTHMHCLGEMKFLKDTAGDAHSYHYAVRDQIHSNIIFSSKPRSRDSSVGIVAGWTGRVRIFARGKQYSIFHSVH